MPGTEGSAKKSVRDALGEHVRDLPVHAARFAVMGIGRALLLTDRVRKEYQEVRESGLGPALGRLRGDAEKVLERAKGRVSGQEKPGTAETPVAQPPDKPHRSAADEPDNVAASRVADSRPVEPTVSGNGSAGTRPAPESTPAEAAGATAEPADKADKVDPGSAETDAKPTAAPPLPNYHELTIASVRARLRNLTLEQVIGLRDYEKAHAGRADFVRMYENRIAKLGTGT